MKKTLIITIIAIAAIQILTGAAEAGSYKFSERWTFNGIRLSEFKVSPVESAAGAATAIITHTIGHYLGATLCGRGMRQNPDNILEEIWSGREDYTAQEMAFVGRLGFLTQLGARYIYKSLGASDEFMTGYDIANLLEISTYKMIHGTDSGDLYDIDQYGNSGAELAIYTGIALSNFGK